MPVRVPRRPLLLALALLTLPTASPAQPLAHHPGAWTTHAKWPGRDSVQAVHMALVRGDTLFARPHSQVLAWGSWTTDLEEGFPNNGGRWGWSPASDACAQAAGNLTLLPTHRPPFNLFCGGHTALPDGDLLVVSGHERTIAGVPFSARFRRESGTWDAAVPMAGRRWYPNATVLPEAQGRILATGGIKYDHVVLFGGRRGDGTLSSDVERYTLTDAGGWEPTLSDSGPNWPAPREYHSLAWQPGGRYYLFGGKDAGGNPRRDVWQLKRTDSDNEESYAWEPLPIDPSSELPPVRCQHAAVVDQPALSDSNST